MLKSIGAFVFVRCRVGGRFWEGPLWEAPLYYMSIHMTLCKYSFMRLHLHVRSDAENYIIIIMHDYIYTVA